MDAFAERFAGAGLDALTFDSFGESSGSPRQLVSIPRQQGSRLTSSPVRFCQVGDTDGVAPVATAEAAASRAAGRAEVRRYPIGHFEIYRGAPFERAVSDQLHLLRR